MYWEIKLTTEELEMLRILLGNSTHEHHKQAVLTAEEMEQWHDDEDDMFAAKEFRALPQNYKTMRIDRLVSDLFAELDRTVRNYNRDDCRYISG